MISISKPKLLAVFIILIIAGGSFYAGRVFSIPAANINSICEPGACSSEDCSYYIYKDTAIMDANTNVTFAKNCVTGANDFKEVNSGSLIQDVLNAIAATPQPSLLPPGGVGGGAQFSIVFGVGYFYIPATLTINFPGNGATAASMTWRGQGEDKTTLILDNNVNGNMTNVINMGNKLQVESIKFFGNRVHQTGVSTIFWFEPSNSGAEYIFTNNEFRDCLTSCLYFQDGAIAWNQFVGNWFLETPIGVDYKTTKLDIRFVANKFGDALGTNVGIQFDAGNTREVVIVGNVFDASSINFAAGATYQTAIVGNTFTDTPTNTIRYQGVGLGGGEFNFRNIISGNVFSTNVGSNVAISLAQFVDGITITSNQFSGYTSSATVPVTLIQTTQKNNTLVTQNSGMGAFWTGFGIAQPTIPASTVNQQNKNPYQVRVYITGTGTGITAYKLTDPSGTSNTFTVTVGVGFAIDVDPYAQIALTYTGTPTWAWYGLANLT